MLRNTFFIIFKCAVEKSKAIQIIFSGDHLPTSFLHPYSQACLHPSVLRFHNDVTLLWFILKHYLGHNFTLDIRSFLFWEITLNVFKIIFFPHFSVVFLGEFIKTLFSHNSINIPMIIYFLLSVLSLVLLVCLNCNSVLFLKN